MKHRLFKFLKDPLFIFFAVGGVLLLLTSDQDAPAPDTLIRVDKANLLEFLQYRQRRFTNDPAAAQWESLSPEAQRTLVTDYIEEEMLVREARRLGLEANDYIIRQRLVQKLGFIAETQQADPADESALREWYQAHQQNYLVPARLSFRHVFFQAGPQANSRALQAKTALARTPEKDGSYGDPFPYHKTYRNRAPDQLVSHFGLEFVQALTAKTPKAVWQGPVISNHGLHLLWISGNNPAYVPAFDEIRAKVAFDLAQQARQNEKTRLLNSLKDRYQIELAEDMQNYGAIED